MHNIFDIVKLFFSLLGKMTNIMTNIKRVKKKKRESQNKLSEDDFSEGVFCFFFYTLCTGFSSVRAGSHLLHSIPVYPHEFVVFFTLWIVLNIQILCAMFD